MVVEFEQQQARESVGCVSKPLVWRNTWRVEVGDSVDSRLQQLDDWNDRNGRNDRNGCLGETRVVKTSVYDQLNGCNDLGCAVEPKVG